ncbi:hypothetical protein [Sedimentibacter saalensis]|uniref:hypothetical protein n=1 Tax=Sedimentibacter saalensis TaxID=130788 RepID=UPI002899E943|nr:hypothetical protein [Sedimentibacter saalensis]
MKNNKYIKTVIFITLLMLLFFMAKDNVSAAYSIFSDTDDEYIKISADYENMYENIKNKNLYEDKLRNINSKINNMNIMTNIRQEQIITVLNEFLSSCFIEASSIDFSEFSDLNNAEAESSDEKSEDRVESALVSVSFKASYNDMLKFIDEIQVCKTGAAIKSVRFVMNDNDEFYGTIDLVFYSLKMDEAYE